MSGGRSVDLSGKVGSLPVAPKPSSDGLILKVKALPEGRVKGAQPPEQLRFTACALTDRGDSLALATDAGHVYVLQLEPHRKRFTQLDPLDGPATAATWKARDRRLLFVAQPDGGVRCYDLASRAFATLCGNRTRARSLSVRVGSEQLAAASAEGVVLWELDTLRRQRLMDATPYGTLQVCTCEQRLLACTPLGKGLW